MRLGPRGRSARRTEACDRRYRGDQASSPPPRARPPPLPRSRAHPLASSADRPPSAALPWLCEAGRAHLLARRSIRRRPERRGGCFSVRFRLEIRARVDLLSLDGLLDLTREKALDNRP